MPDIEFIKDSSLDKAQITQNIDLEAVESIVSRLKQKYEKEGVLDKVDSGNLNELRSLIAEGKRSKVEVQKPSDLKTDLDPIIRKIGNLYSSLQKFFAFIISYIYRYIPAKNTLAFELYSANINYSTSQYLAITSVVSSLLSIGFTIFIFSIFIILDYSLLLAFIISIIFFFACSILMLYYPSMAASSRAKAIDRELPFALRHMATELKAGVGLYRVLQSIAVANYGIFSEEIARTISEVEEGLDTKDALKNLALRTKSYSLKNSINHLLRALKTGGALSEAMNNIAEEVSFELRIQIESFSEKMNFFGVIYIFAGIVVPVMLAILGGIRNAPLGNGVSFFAALPLTPTIILISYTVLLPVVMLALVYYVRSIRPTM